MIGPPPSLFSFLNVACILWGGSPLITKPGKRNCPKWRRRLTSVPPPKKVEKYIFVIVRSFSLPSEMCRTACFTRKRLGFFLWARVIFSTLFFSLYGMHLILELSKRRKEGEKNLRKKIAWFFYRRSQGGIFRREAQKGTKSWSNTLDLRHFLCIIQGQWETL